MVRITYITCILLGLLFSQTTLALTQITATVDKNPVVEKQSFVLQITADDDIDSNALDTSALLKDFIVGRTNVSSQTSVINFDTTRTTKWTTVLIARKAGQVTIPSFEIDSFKTTPIVLNVLESTTQSTQKQQDIFITSEVSSKDIYVQQQLTLTVKLHFAAQLKNGSLTEPSLDGAKITKISEDKENDAIINGKRYRVIERHYVINPQKSGEFILNTPFFSGEILTKSNNGRGSFLNFAETKPVSVLGEEIKLTIKPIPDNYQGVWLPSEILTLHQEWQPASDTFKVGEPITRTITLTSAGLSEEQLPKLTVELPKEIKVYPDQPELHTGMNSNRLVSQKKQNFALVASKVGTYELPEIVIPWWNTVTNKLQQAILPAKTITILPNDDLEVSAPVLPPVITENTSTSVPPTIITVTESSWLQWLFLALWLLTSLAWIITILLNRKESIKLTPKTKNNTNILNQLISACNTNKADSVLTLIIPWAQQQYPTENISTLDDIKHVNNNIELNHALTELQQSMYGKSPTAWSGEALLNIIKNMSKKEKNTTQKSISLNP